MVKAERNINHLLSAVLLYSRCNAVVRGKVVAGRVFVSDLFFGVGDHIFTLSDVTCQISWLPWCCVIFSSFLDFAVTKETSAFTLSSLYCASLV